MSEPRMFPSGEIFHICNKSISNYHIFRKEKSIERFLTTINYYNNNNVNLCFSKAIREPLDLPDIMNSGQNRVFSILAYCVMPDHYHLLLRVENEYLFSKCMSDLENSYSRYYNLYNHRNGPLWQSRFRASLIEDNETLLHVHRYIHLNPATANLVDKPELWSWSSYNYFLSNSNAFTLNKEISISTAKQYKKFVENQIDYQRTIKGIRRKLLE